MRVVIRAPGGQVDERDVEFLEELDELTRIGLVRLDRVVLVGAEPVGVGQVLLEGSGDTGAQSSAIALIGIRLEGDEVEGAEANTDIEVGMVRPDAGHDLAKKARPIFEGAAIRSGAGEAAQELVAQVAVTVLDVHELIAEVGRHIGRPDVVVDQPLDLVVGQDRVV